MIPPRRSLTFILLFGFLVASLTSAQVESVENGDELEYEDDADDTLLPSRRADPEMDALATDYEEGRRPRGLLAALFGYPDEFEDGATGDNAAVEAETKGRSFGSTRDFKKSRSKVFTTMHPKTVPFGKYFKSKTTSERITTTASSTADLEESVDVDGNVTAMTQKLMTNFTDSEALNETLVSFNSSGSSDFDLEMAESAANMTNGTETKSSLSSKREAKPSGNKAPRNVARAPGFGQSPPFGTGAQPLPAGYILWHPVPAPFFGGPDVPEMPVASNRSPMIAMPGPQGEDKNSGPPFQEFVPHRPLFVEPFQDPFPPHGPFPITQFSAPPVFAVSPDEPRSRSRERTKKRGKGRKSKNRPKNHPESSEEEGPGFFPPRGLAPVHVLLPPIPPNNFRHGPTFEQPPLPNFGPQGNNLPFQPNFEQPSLRQLQFDQRPQPSQQFSNSPHPPEGPNNAQQFPNQPHPPEGPRNPQQFNNGPRDPQQFNNGPRDPPQFNNGPRDPPQFNNGPRDPQRFQNGPSPQQFNNGPNEQFNNGPRDPQQFHNGPNEQFNNGQNEQFQGPREQFRGPGQGPQQQQKPNKPKRPSPTPSAHPAKFEIEHHKKLQQQFESESGPPFPPLLGPFHLAPIPPPPSPANFPLPPLRQQLFDFPTPPPPFSLSSPPPQFLDAPASQSFAVPKFQPKPLPSPPPPHSAQEHPPLATTSAPFKSSPSAPVHSIPPLPIPPPSPFPDQQQQTDFLPVTPLSQTDQDTGLIYTRDFQKQLNEIQPTSESPFFQPAFSTTPAPAKQHQPNFNSGPHFGLPNLVQRFPAISAPFSSNQQQPQLPNHFGDRPRTRQGSRFNNNQRHQQQSPSERNQFTPQNQQWSQRHQDASTAASQRLPDTHPNLPDYKPDLSLNQGFTQSTTLAPESLPPGPELQESTPFSGPLDSYPSPGFHTGHKGYPSSVTAPNHIASSELPLFPSTPIPRVHRPKTTTKSPNSQFRSTTVKPQKQQKNFFGTTFQSSFASSTPHSKVPDYHYEIHYQHPAPAQNSFAPQSPHYLSTSSTAAPDSPHGQNQRISDFSGHSTVDAFGPLQDSVSSSSTQSSFGVDTAPEYVSSTFQPSQAQGGSYKPGTSRILLEMSRWKKGNSRLDTDSSLQQ